MNDFDREIIFNSGINIAEYHILSLFYIEGSRQRKYLSRYADEYFGAVRRSSSQTINEYEKAIDSCLANFYIKILSKDDCKHDEKRWEYDDNQFCEDDKYLPGNLDFTIKGSQFYRQIKEKIFHRNGINPSIIFDGVIGFKWKHQGILSIFTKRFKNLKENINMMHKDPTYLLVEKQLIEIGKPIKIGPWWITRFDKLNSGWRVDIKYN